MCRSISKLLTLIIIVVCASSCALPLYHQVATMSSPHANINEDGFFVVENDIVDVKYDFWQSYGQVRFLITNKTDEEIRIDLTRSYYIRNGIALDYWVDKPYANIPAHCSILLGDYVITDAPYRDCGLARNPEKNEEAIVSFSLDNSPIVIDNRLLIIHGDDEIPLSSIFYISTIQNYPKKSVVQHIDYTLDCSGTAKYDPQSIYLMQCPYRYYMEYYWDYDMSSDRVNN